MDYYQMVPLVEYLNLVCSWFHHSTDWYSASSLILPTHNGLIDYIAIQWHSILILFHNPSEIWTYTILPLTPIGSHQIIFPCTRLFNSIMYLLILIFVTFSNTAVIRFLTLSSVLCNARLKLELEYCNTVFKKKQYEKPAPSVSPNPPSSFHSIP